MLALRKPIPKEMPKLVNMKHLVKEEPLEVFEKFINAPDKESLFQRQRKDYRVETSPFKSSTIDR